jgi:hypothetical protein
MYNTARKNSAIHNKTRKNIKISGKILDNRDGWIIAEIRGSPYERGYANGHLFYRQFKLLKNALPFIVKKEIKQPFGEYIKKSTQLIKPQLSKYFPEFLEEMRGMVSGAKKRGVNISLDFIIAWNAYVSLDSYFNDGKNSEKCSAFIAAGNATEAGDVIVAHNTHYDLMSARLYNIFLYVFPDKGHSFVMQTAPGLIFSAIDWFICANGIIGTETTIADINYKPNFGDPIFCRIRQAMQYANSLDEYVNILLHNNAGDYACGWMFGDTRTGEIMLFELGLKKHSIQRTKNGVFYGMNSPINKELRESETDSKEFNDTATPIGNRRKRLDYLLNKEYYGKINISNSKKVLSDHYDYSLGKQQMNRKSICKHTENDSTGKHPYKLAGAFDGKVANTSMIKTMSFLARYGSSCGKRHFIKEEYLKEHPEKEEYRKFIVDIPIYPWTLVDKYFKEKLK